MNIITIENVAQWVKTWPIHDRDWIERLDWNSRVENFIVGILSKTYVFTDIEAIAMFRDKVVPHILGLDEIETLLNKRLDDQEKQLKIGKTSFRTGVAITKEYIGEVVGLPDIKTAKRGSFVQNTSFKHMLMKNILENLSPYGSEFADMAAYEAFMKLIWPHRYELMNAIGVDFKEKQVLPKIYERLKQKTLQVNVSEKQRVN